MDTKASISSYTIYGTYLNIEGSLDTSKDYDDLDLVLYDGDFISYEMNITEGG